MTVWPVYFWRIWIAALAGKPACCAPLPSFTRKSMVAAQRGATMSRKAASPLAAPPHMYSMPCAIWIGGFENAWAGDMAPRKAATADAPPRTSAATGCWKRLGFIALCVLDLA
ncbi:hypothetical protein D9M69_684650 [compost metagenome]